MIPYYHLISQELEELEQLRPEWAVLIRKADRIRSLFLKDKRAMYEQEIDKHIKVWVLSFPDFSDLLYRTSWWR